MPTVLISGATRGLGLALAGAFRGAGASVFSGARGMVGAKDVELNVRSIPSCEDAVRRVVATDGGIDILVNNAGVHLGGPVASLDQDAFKETLDVNLLGAWRLTKAAVPHMRRGGTIAMISSLSGLVGLPDDGAYAASKFALEGLSQSLAAEVAPLGLRVLLFEPGRVATEFAGVTDGLAPDIAARDIVDAIQRRDTPFRNPIGADAVRVFEALGVDRGERSEALVRAVTGCDWQPQPVL
ncbi:MAG: SDR family NAD(P)-dependent oxidoreductase [Sphingopyxis sp.]|uniref:SDR family NAD(P)-dependent oxidoreductase n=1 Tax=Sphingopyxis sp. TaxID=1908224 RepID=UPI003D6D3B74